MNRGNACGLPLSAIGLLLAFFVGCAKDKRDAAMPPVARATPVITLLHTINAYAYPIRHVAFSPDGSQVACVGWEMSSLPWASNYHPIKLYNVADGQHSVTLKSRAGLDAGLTLKFAPDGKELVTMGVASAEIWNFRDGKLLRKVKIADGRTLASSTKGNLWVIAAGYKDKSRIEIWTKGFAEKTSSLAEGEDTSWIALSPDGRMLATSNWQKGVVRLWNLERKQAEELFVFGRGMICMCFSPDGKRLFAGGHSSTLDGGSSFAGLDGGIWDLEEKKLVELPRGVGGTAEDAEFSPDGRTLTIAGFGATLWDVSSARLLGRVRAWGGEEEVYKEYAKLKESVPLREFEVKAVAFSPDGKMLATGGLDGVLQLWDVSAVTARPAGSTQFVSTTAVPGTVPRLPPPKRRQ